MKDILPSHQLDVLFDAVMSLDTREDCYAFFADLCTMSELRAMSQRFHVAQMLHLGNVYADIVAETGASTATISRVNRALLYGADGYKRILDGPIE
ncbi:MAG: TrpR-like protein, YerC/YecD [Oscillospiraceae bacterium]|jgi:TrpR-related protein YerC/YecD|nr:TrpR-like protein, YerC/YecD [Oscillospiraceae bacterium]